MITRPSALAALAALVFLAAHARTLPPALEDIDSINFAMGVESFDVASHRPHPPGYPVYIAIAKVSTAAVGAIAPSWDRDRRAAAGLAVWSVIAGALAALVLTAFWRASGLAPAPAFLAAMLAVTSPLFWFTSSRPLSDVPGLVAAIAVQVLLVRGWQGLSASAPGALRDCVLGAAGAGLVIGLRSQAMWINGPPLVWIAIGLLARRRVTDAALLAAASIAGVLVWFVPLVIDTGGPAAFLRALGSQGAQDFGGITMLATSPTDRVLRAAIADTFVAPWRAPALAYAVLLAALIGAAAAIRHDRRLLSIVLLSFGPYLAFHLAFHETATLRYALPIVIPVAGFAVAAVARLGRWPLVVGTAVLAAVSLVLGQPALASYARTGWPIARAFQQMQRARPAAGPDPMVRTHHQVWHGVRRTMDWYRPLWDVGPQPFPGDREWLDLVGAWRGGDPRPVWFLADVTRNDLRLFDPRARERRDDYLPDPDVLALTGDDTRLDALRWVVVNPPAWMLGSGWSLTPEIAGMTSKDRIGPHVRPADGFLRRGPGSIAVLVGGRVLAGPATVTARLDDRVLRAWTVTSASPWFVEWIDLPDGVPAGEGPYAHLTIVVAGAPGGPTPQTLLEQFDAAPAGAPMMAFASDWHEQEGNPQTGRLWRWTTDRSTIEIRNTRGDVRLTIEGESPLLNFDRPPVVVVAAGGAELARFNPAADFRQTIDVPAGVLAAAGGRVTIATDLVFVPGEREASPDRRRLGLRILDVQVTGR